MNWISVDERLPEVVRGRFRVRLKDGSELEAFFYKDAICWAHFYGHTTSHWYKAQPFYDLLDNVTHWEEKEEKKVKSEWGGTLRCLTSDGRNVNVAEEMNRLEKEKKDDDA